MNKLKFAIGVLSMSLLLLVVACVKDVANRDAQFETQKTEPGYAQILPNIDKILTENFDNTRRMVSVLKSKRQVVDRFISPTLLNLELDALANLAPRIPQYPYNQSLVQSNDLEAIMQATGYLAVLNDAAFPLSEKSYWTNIINLNSQSDFVGLKNYIINNRTSLQNGNYSGLSSDGKDRLLFMFGVIESVINYYGVAINSPATYVQDPCDLSKVAKSAISSAVVGGLRGLWYGCRTGLVLGFNPGSAAAGCMGGFLVGVLVGAATGTAAGLYNNC